MRIGHGYDAHRFAAGRPLVLGGVTIPHDQGLEAHSDGDVLIHALCDALLGAAGLGDIGRHFPDTDERYRGADSTELLKSVPRCEEAAHLRLSVLRLVEGRIAVPTDVHAPDLVPLQTVGHWVPLIRGVTEVALSPHLLIAELEQFLEEPLHHVGETDLDEPVV